MPLKILHIADVHLGAKFLGLGRKGALQRAQLLETFDKAIRLALDEGVDLFMIAGDLFDTQDVSKVLRAQVASRIERLTGAGIEVCVSPGTHDPYGPASPYAAPPLSELDRLTVFTEETMTGVRFPQLDCTVYGNANTRPFENKYPLQGFKAEGESRWEIGMVHANFEIPDVTVDTYIVTPSHVAECGLDYLALGHLHSLSDRSANRTRAFYSGCPEMIQMKKGDVGNVLMVELADEAVVTPVKIGARSFEEVNLQAEQMGSLQELVTGLEERADPDKILKVNIEGLRRAGYPDIDSLIAELSDEFFFITVSDRSRPSPAAVDPGSYPDDSPTGAFLGVLGSRMEGATESEKEELLEAMQVGLSLLEEG